MQLHNETRRNFPTKTPKFSGNPLRDGGTYLTEFLPSLETAQEYCNLSKKEFEQILLLCTTGKSTCIANRTDKPRREYSYYIPQSSYTL
jgi:hypothetical protein